MRHCKFLALALVLISTSAGAQTRRLYATDGYDQGVYTIQGGAATAPFASSGGMCAYGLAVASTVRTVGCQSGANGQEYTLGGTPIGSPYANTSGSSCCFYDGTTDGTYNYASGYVNRAIWRGGADWSGLAPLFSLAYTPIGITYDSGTNSLWVGEYNNTNAVSIFQYAMNGTLLSSFAPILPTSSNGITALAYDQADGTLWFSNYDGNGTMYQYTRAGVQLSSVNVSGTYNGFLLGAEFQIDVVTTPEPASMVLLGTGLIGVAGFARRRRKA